MSHEDYASIVWESCMRLGRDERALVVADESKLTIARRFYKTAQTLTEDAALMLIRPRETNGQEPPDAVARALTGCDVALLVTSYSLSHTKARRQACRGGTRVASMPGITESMARRALAVDHGAIQRENRRIKKAIGKHDTLEIRAPGGTEIRLSIAGRYIYDEDCGLFHEPGSFGNLPSGEVTVAPVEGSAEGVIVVDRSMAGIGRLRRPLRIEVRKGRAVGFKGEGAAALRRVFDARPVKARTVAELGIGTNPAARITGTVLEDEKVQGTVHLALGSNASFGGTVQTDVHLDGVVADAEIWAAGRRLYP
jgi:leucyl aminopeptidase (aminopeptidase T)